MSAAAAAAAPYALVCELGVGFHSIERFSDEAAARKKAAGYWCCWCLFHQLNEVATGGVGLSVTRAGIRQYAAEALNPLTADVRFSNYASRPAGDESIAPECRISFGVVYPAGLGCASTWMVFDRTKPVERIITGAAALGGLTLDKGKLAGSPEKLNLFTLDGDMVRLDLEIDAHVGSTLRAGDLLLLEKGNRVPANRLEAVRRLLGGSA